jgi:hypothetical protein
MAFATGVRDQNRVHRGWGLQTPRQLMEKPQAFHNKWLFQTGRRLRQLRALQIAILMESGYLFAR